MCSSASLEVVPEKLSVIMPPLQVVFEAPGRHLDEAFQRVHARTGSECVGEVLIRPALADELRIARALLVADAREHGAGTLDPKSVDQLSPQPAERVGVEQQHTLVVEPDPAVAQREKQAFR